MTALALLLFTMISFFLIRSPLRASAAPLQQASPVSVQVTLSRTHATVGDPIGLTILIRSPRDALVDTSNIENQFTPFELLSANHPTRQGGPNGASELRLGYQVAVYHTGDQQFPALTVHFTQNGQAATVQSQSVSFIVDSVIPPGDPATDIRPLKPQLDLPAPGPAPIRTLLTVAAAVVAVALLGLAAWMLARRNEPALAVAPLVPAPLEEEARADLDQIAAAGLLARGEYHEHYARLALCIRRYLRRRYGFPASALTTSELEARMQESGVGRWRARLVADLLEACDAVHYAHYIPAPARAEADLERAYEIVDLTLSQETRLVEVELEVGAR